MIIKSDTYNNDYIKKFHNDKIISLFTRTNFGIENNKKAGYITVRKSLENNDYEIKEHFFE